MSPEEARAKFDLGTKLITSGDVAEGKRILLELAEYHIQRGKFCIAVVVYSIVLQKEMECPGKVEILRKMAEVYEKLNRIDKAEVVRKDADRLAMRFN